MPQLPREQCCLHLMPFALAPSSMPAPRPLQPKSFGVAHLAAVYLLTYLGAFCAALLAASYASQNVQQWQVGWEDGSQAVCLQV